MGIVSQLHRVFACQLNIRPEYYVAAYYVAMALFHTSYSQISARRTTFFLLFFFLSTENLILQKACCRNVLSIGQDHFILDNQQQQQWSARTYMPCCHAATRTAHIGLQIALLLVNTQRMNGVGCTNCSSITTIYNMIIIWIIREKWNMVKRWRNIVIAAILARLRITLNDRSCMHTEWTHFFPSHIHFSVMT